MKALVGAFNQEKALVGAFSVIVQPVVEPMEYYTALLQAYVVYKCVTRFLTYISLPWPEDKQPYLELNLYVGLVGAGVVLLPFFFISFMFKIGNLPNDGYKLGYNLSTCSLDPPSVLAR